MVKNPSWCYSINKCLRDAKLSGGIATASYQLPSFIGHDGVGLFSGAVAAGSWVPMCLYVCNPRKHISSLSWACE